MVEVLRPSAYLKNNRIAIRQFINDAQATYVFATIGRTDAYALIMTNLCCSDKQLSLTEVSNSALS